MQIYIYLDLLKIKYNIFLTLFLNYIRDLCDIKIVFRANF